MFTLSFTITIFLPDLIGPLQFLNFRVIPVFMLLQWLNIPGENEVPQGQRHTTRLDKLSPPAHCKDVKGGRVHRQGYKRAKSQNK